MPAETNHVIGQEGVLLAKRYLESTTHLALPHTVYDNEGLCAFERLDGTLKRFDMVGHFRTGASRPVAVECKKVTGVAGQPDTYDEFLANAYSITARHVRIGADDKREFMFVTWHPFSQTKWIKLRDSDAVREALGKNEAALGGDDIDEELLRTVANRLWLMPLHDRMEELLLEPHELYKVLGALERRS